MIAIIEGEMMPKKYDYENLDRYREIVNELPLMICCFSPNGEILFANKPYCDYRGKTIDELVGLNLLSLIPDADQTITRDHISALTFDSPKQAHVHSIIDSDGDVSYQRWTTQAIFDANGNVVEYRAIGEDITEQKQTQSDLNESERLVRHLSSQLLAAQEIERRSISMELHDQVGPELVVLNIRLKCIAEQLRKDQEHLKAEVIEVMAFANKIVEDLRRISRNLSPAMIEEIKLCKTLYWMLKDFKRHTGIDVSMDLLDVDDQFCHDDQILIYRIFQESLNNIQKHAQANTVCVDIKKEGSHVIFRIKDDGQGFDFNEAINRHVTKRGMGLPALNERVRMLGGTFDLFSEKGIGTRLTLVIPQSAKQT